MTPGKLKPLFESSYVSPLKNPLVIQDNDPVKQLAINDAIKRYQEELDRRNKTDEHLHVKHLDRVKQDEDLTRIEQEIKRRKQEMFCREITNQIRQDVSE